jgi:hypothetical protein
LQIGPTNETIKAYLTRGNSGRAVAPNSDIHITKVSLGHDSSRVTFQTDEFLEISVEATARALHEDMSVVIQIVDDNQYAVFDTCTQRLGAGPLALAAGETLTSTFRIHLRLGQGTYHVNAFLHRYVTDRPFDRYLLAATFFVAGTPTVRGVANLAPALVGCEKTTLAGRSASNVACVP